MKAPEQIRAWVDAEGRKQEWLAACIPANPSDVSRWLNGHVTPRRMYRARLAEITGLPVSDEASWK